MCVCVCVGLERHHDDNDLSLSLRVFIFFFVGVDSFLVRVKINHVLWTRLFWYVPSCPSSLVGIRTFHRLKYSWFHRLLYVNELFLSIKIELSLSSPLERYLAILLGTYKEMWTNTPEEPPGSGEHRRNENGCRLLKLDACNNQQSYRATNDNQSTGSTGTPISQEGTANDTRDVYHVHQVELLMYQFITLRNGG